jgi:hypothetical protein
MMHRPLGKQHDLTASLSEVAQRVVTHDHTIRHDTKGPQIVREDIRPRMPDSTVRFEARRNGEIAVDSKTSTFVLRNVDPRPKLRFSQRQPRQPARSLLLGRASMTSRTARANARGSP